MPENQRKIQYGPYTLEITPVAVDVRWTASGTYIAIKVSLREAMRVIYKRRKWDLPPDPFFDHDAPPSRLLDDVDPAWGLPRGHHDHPLNVEYRRLVEINRPKEATDEPADND